MKEVYLSIGSNLGDRISYIKSAIEQLQKCAELHTVSSLYETPPWGYNSSNPYYNCVVKMSFKCNVVDFLKHTQSIEIDLGRREKTSSTYVDRVVDIDIVYIKGMLYHSVDLTIPHKQMHKRAFVLLPMLDIEDELLANYDKKVSDFLSELDCTGIIRIDGGL